jgi:hypothetical protein
MTRVHGPTVSCATGVAQDEELSPPPWLAEATPATARKLVEISGYITQSFRALLARFCGLNGVSVADRSAFLMGLYDGMMNETRSAGQRLPERSHRAKKQKARKSSDTAGVSVHPWSSGSTDKCPPGDSANASDTPANIPRLREEPRKHRIRHFRAGSRNLARLT